MGRNINNICFQLREIMNYRIIMERDFFSPDTVTSHISVSWYPSSPPTQSSCLLWCCPGWIIATLPVHLPNCRRKLQRAGVMLCLFYTGETGLPPSSPSYTDSYSSHLITRWQGCTTHDLRPVWDTDTPHPTRSLVSLFSFLSPSSSSDEEQKEKYITPKQTTLGSKEASSVDSCELWSSSHLETAKEDNPGPHFHRRINV